MAEEVYSGITQEQYEQARLMGIFKNQMDIQSIKVEAKREREARIRAEQELAAVRERTKQIREQTKQVRERAKQELAAVREQIKLEQERIEQALAAERERAELELAAVREQTKQVRQQAIAVMRERGLSDKDIDRIYPET
ncbi:hypothetical protein ACYULU_05805 [Breznakiellaceae bacterium SP9]